MQRLSLLAAAPLLVIWTSSLAPSNPSAPKLAEDVICVGNEMVIDRDCAECETTAQAMIQSSCEGCPYTYSLSVVCAGEPFGQGSSTSGQGGLLCDTEGRIQVPCPPQGVGSSSAVISLTCGAGGCDE
jgi:hypothetical protein